MFQFKQTKVLSQGEDSKKKFSKISNGGTVAHPNMHNIEHTFKTKQLGPVMVEAPEGFFKITQSNVQPRRVLSQKK